MAHRRCLWAERAASNTYSGCGDTIFFSILDIDLEICLPLISRLALVVPLTSLVRKTKKKDKTDKNKNSDRPKSQSLNSVLTETKPSFQKQRRQKDVVIVLLPKKQSPCLICLVKYP